MDRYDREHLKRDVMDELHNWYLKIMYRWYPGCMKDHTKDREPLDVYRVRRPRFEIKIFYPGNYAPYYLCPNPELSIHDKKFNWGYTICLSKSEVETCINPELYFARLADKVYMVFEEEDQKRIKKMMNSQYGLIREEHALPIGNYTAEVLAQEFEKVNKNSRSYRADSVDALTYSLQVMGHFNAPLSREEIYRQTKEQFQKIKDKVLSDCNVQPVMITGRGSGKWATQMEVYRKLLEDSITKSLKEDLEMSSKRNPYPHQAVVVFSNGENLLMDVESIDREGMSPYRMMGIKIAGRYAYPDNSENDKDLKEILDSWRASLRPELKPKKVIFNNPATIVIWADDTKTIVKCQTGEMFDPEKGLALCYMKKCLGNKGNFNETLKKEISRDYFLEEYDRLKKKGKTESEMAKILLGDWATVAALRAKRAYELQVKKLKAEQKKKEAPADETT